MSAASELNDKIRSGEIVCMCVPFDPLIGRHNYGCIWAWAVDEIYRLGRLEDGVT